jgi:hypothetical protein
MIEFFSIILFGKWIIRHWPISQIHFHKAEIYVDKLKKHCLQFLMCTFETCVSYRDKTQGIGVVYLYFNLQMKQS